MGAALCCGISGSKSRPGSVAGKQIGFDLLEKLSTYVLPCVLLTQPKSDSYTIVQDGKLFFRCGFLTGFQKHITHSHLEVMWRL